MPVRHALCIAIDGLRALGSRRLWQCLASDAGPRFACQPVARPGLDAVRPARSGPLLRSGLAVLRSVPAAAARPRGGSRRAHDRRRGRRRPRRAAWLPGDSPHRVHRRGVGLVGRRDGAGPGVRRRGRSVRSVGRGRQSPPELVVAPRPARSTAPGMLRGRTASRSWTKTTRRPRRSSRRRRSPADSTTMRCCSIAPPTPRRRWCSTSASTPSSAPCRADRSTTTRSSCSSARAAMPSESTASSAAKRPTCTANGSTSRASFAVPAAWRPRPARRDS